MEIRKLSENGVDFAVATVTDAVGHNQMKSSLTKLIDTYNLTQCIPGDYDINSAITTLDKNLTDKQKVIGVHVKYTGSTGNIEEWEYFGGGYKFTDPMGWRQVDSSVLLELENEVFPISLSFSTSQSLVQTGISTPITLSWNVKRKGADVTGNSIVYLNGSQVTGDSKTETINQASHTSTTYNLTAAYQGLSKNASVTINVVDLCYVGIVSADKTVTASDIQNFTKLGLKNTRAYTWSGINTTYQKTVYAYPAYFGALTSIKDANNFEYIGSYTMNTLTVGGVSYYVYVLSQPTTISNFKQIFS